MLIAHRGFRTQQGENRMLDFEKALKITKAVEFDIRLTKDQKVIIFHDHTFKRIGGIDQSVNKFTYAQIKEIDFFKKNWEYLPPLFIDDFANNIANKYEFINVEIKPSRYSREQYLILEKALTILRNKTKAEIVVSSFGKNDLGFISMLDTSKFKKGYLVESLSLINYKLIKKFDYFHPYVGSLKQAKAKGIIDKVNLPLNVWTFKNNADAKFIAKRYNGLINGFISDKQDLDCGG